MEAPSDKGPPQSPPPPLEKRHPSNRAQIASAIFSAFTALAAVLAMVSFFEATSAQKQHNAEEAIARLYPMDVNVNQPLGANPRVREALYDDPDGEVFNELTPKEKTLLQAACDAIGDEFEYYLLIRDHIRCHPQGSDIVKAWDGYLRRTWRRSYGLRDDINSNREIWTTTFLKEFDDNTSGLKPASAVPGSVAMASRRPRRARDASMKLATTSQSDAGRGRGNARTRSMVH